MTVLLCIAAALIPAAFAFGAHCAALSARDRIAAAYRAQSRAICLAEALADDVTILEAENRKLTAATLRSIAP